MSTYRTGNHWGVTIVREATGSVAHGEGPALVAVVVNGDHHLAERICRLLNGELCEHAGLHQCGGLWRDHAEDRRILAIQIADSCTCRGEPDPACPVHQGRRARGPKPPPLGVGCICDGSGRTCPRHGAVL